MRVVQPPAVAVHCGPACSTWRRGVVRAAGHRPGGGASSGRRGVVRWRVIVHAAPRRCAGRRRGPVRHRV